MSDNEVENIPESTNPAENNNPTAPPTSKESFFECNICLDTASEPVLTPCGHLFCWSCLYQWMDSDRSLRNTCPVCKAAIATDKLTPIYTRGNESRDPRKNIPERPRPVRQESAVTQRRAAAPMFHAQSLFGPFAGPQVTFGNVSFSTALFPGMFGMQFNMPPAVPQQVNQQQMTPEQIRQAQQQAQFSLMMLLFGTFVLFSLLLL